MRKAATTLESEMSPNEVNFLTGLIRRNAFAGKFLEVGTASGGTLCLMIKAAHQTGQLPMFVVVDPMNYFENQADTVRRNLAQNGISLSHVELRPMPSHRAYTLAARKGEKFDFMLIDGAHKIKYVTQDLRWTRLLNPGGIILFHDYNKHTRDVTWPVNRLLKNHRNYEIIGRADSLLAIRKKAASRRKEVTPFDHLFALSMAPLFQGLQSLKKYIRRFKRWAGMEKSTPPSR